MDNTLKTKIDNLWQFMWNAGMANPLTNLQQITYLIFIKMLDDKQILDEKKLNTIKSIDPSAKLENPVFKEGNYVDETEGITVNWDDSNFLFKFETDGSLTAQQALDIAIETLSKEAKGFAEDIKAL